MLQVALGPESCLKLLWFALQAQIWLARRAQHSQTLQTWLVDSVVCFFQMGSDEAPSPVLAGFLAFFQA